jgi:hypothetical protein
LKINSFNDNEHSFPIDTLQIENTYAFEINNTNNSTKIVNNNYSKENKTNIMTFNSSKEVGLEKDSNNEIHDQKEDNNLDLKNTTLQNTGLSTTTTKSSNSIGGFNFAAAGDWACT